MTLEGPSIQHICAQVPSTCEDRVFVPEPRRLGTWTPLGEDFEHFSACGPSYTPCAREATKMRFQSSVLSRTAEWIAAMISGGIYQAVVTIKGASQKSCAFFWVSPS